MKKLLTLVVAGCMVLGSLGTASAVDVKVKGQWWFHYGYASNAALVDQSETGKHADRFRARQRIRTQIEFIADENLSAMLNFEHNSHWGDTNKGGNGPANTYGAIDADNGSFVVKHAYLNWTIPNTQIQTRFGMQGISMPAVAGANPVLNADVAGITVAAQLTPEIGLTAFWARPYDREHNTTTNQTNGQNSLDEVDVFGVVLPIKTDVVRVSPWGAIALIGKDSEWYGNGRNYSSMGVPTQARRNSDFDSTGWGWWAGVSFELPVIDPFFVNIDAMMGGLETGDGDYDAFGWYVAADIGYKFSWGTTSVIGVYSSGDKDTDDYGQLPIISGDSGWNLGGPSGSFYGFGGASWRRYDGYISDSGQGLWGLGFKIANVSFVENLKHSLLAMYYGGTNEGDSQNNRRTVRDFTTNTRTLMTSDHAWEVSLLNEYKVNQNLSFRFDIGYIQLELGDQWKDKDDTKGNVYSGIGIQYSF